MFAPDDIRNVAIIGHKGSGKTQLAEALLYVAKATAKLGKVDDKSSILDESVEEKEHACSLETSVASLSWGGKKINIVDTPGEGSFLADTRLALGMSGSLEGKGFVVLGRLQLDQGEGAWDEWYVTWADGRFAEEVMPHFKARKRAA